LECVLSLLSAFSVPSVAKIFRMARAHSRLYTEGCFFGPFGLVLFSCTSNEQRDRSLKI
jgi:hypothetical protein